MNKKITVFVLILSLLVSMCPFSVIASASHADALKAFGVATDAETSSDKITRSAFVTMAVRMSGATPYTGEMTDFPFVDVDPASSEYSYVKAAYDLGLVNGRENHHLDSGRIIRSDGRLREWFSSDEIEIIAQAAEDHRASGRSAPRSIYGMLVAEADRVIDGDTIIRRTLQFGQKHYPELDRDGHIERAVAHLREKYGRGGYLRLWIPWSDNAARLSELQDMIADDAAIHETTSKEFEKLCSD